MACAWQQWNSMQCMHIADILITAMPAAGAVETSKTALHFATTAKRVQMKPVVNEVKNDKTVIARMQLEIHELRAQLVSPASSPGAQLAGGTCGQKRAASLHGARRLV
jgi:hypothetical protein